MTCQEDFKHVEQMPSIGYWRCHGTSSDGSGVVRIFEGSRFEGCPAPPTANFLDCDNFSDISVIDSDFFRYSSVKTSSQMMKAVLFPPCSYLKKRFVCVKG